MRFGVVRFPGSCDERRRAAGLRARRRGRAALARRPRPAGRRRGRRPRRLLLRRLPARRRDRALLAGHGVGRRVRPRRRARCSASATASRSCARRACCPARCCRTSGCASSAARSTSRSCDADTPFTRDVRDGRAAVDPGQAHDRPLLRAAEQLDALEADGQVVLRYAADGNPNGSSNDIAGVCNEARQRLRPDAPPRARRRRADRLGRRAEAVRRRRPRCAPMPEAAVLPGVEDAVALGLTRDEYALVCEKLGREPNEVELAMFSLHVERALRLQALQEAAAHAADRGPRAWSWARARTPARSTSATAWRVAFKVESHNHPSAVEPFQGAATGVGGILRDIFAIGARPIAVLDSLRFGEPVLASARATCSTARSRASATTATRSACRRSAARSTSRARTRPNCLVNAMALGLARRGRPDPLARRRASATRSCSSARRPGATASAARRCWPRPSSARTTRPSARPSRSATRSRRRSCSSARWSCSSAGCSSRCRTSARPG